MLPDLPLELDDAKTSATYISSAILRLDNILHSSAIFCFSEYLKNLKTKSLAWLWKIWLICPFVFRFLKTVIIY